MNSYVVDAWAWIEYLIGSEYGSKVNEILENEGNEIYTCAVYAEMRRKQKDFGLADSYVLATARKLESKILTGDMHFKNLAEAILLK